MTRSFTVNGECLVRVKGGQHLSGIMDSYTELGLADKNAVKIIPKFYHHDIKVDDFGPYVPAEVLSYLAEVQIKMNLIHYDKDILDVCYGEALGGGDPGNQF